MKAIVAEGFGETNVLSLAALDSVKMEADDVLIKVQASGLNGADLMQRRGLYPPPPGTSPLLGLEVSGRIEEIGAAATGRGLKVGDRVMALLSGGGYAEKVAVRYDQLMKLPDNLDLVQAGGVAEVFLTAYLELIWLGKLEKGHRLLIHAGASGVGTAAIQIAKRYGAEVFVTASSEKKLKFCEALGADHLINYKSEDFVKVIHEKSSGSGVNCILDLVGAVHFQNNLKALAVEGKLLLVGMGGGAKSEMDLRQVVSKRLQIIGSTLRSRSLDEKGKLIAEFWNDAKARFESREYKPVIDRVYPYTEVRDAHQYMESKENIGKILLKWELDS